MYEMLVGAPPFSGSNFAQLFEQHLHASPPSLLANNRSLPPAIDSLVRDLLEKTPEQRPFSARRSLAERIRSNGREISWLTVAGIFAIAATVVVIAWAIGQ